jgi:hypothetical protein
MYKSFDKELWLQYDELGRNTVKDFIERTWNIEVRDNPDKYGVDLLLYSNDKLQGYAEVEVRNSWKSKLFPFNDLNVPSRKEKLLNNSLPTFFFSVNKNANALLFCKAEDVLSSPLVENKNKYISKGELFYKIPLDKLNYVDLED